MAAGMTGLRQAFNQAHRPKLAVRRPMQSIPGVDPYATVVNVGFRASQQH
jgi:hypothetical protein